MESKKVKLDLVISYGLEFKNMVNKEFSALDKFDSISKFANALLLAMMLEGYASSDPKFLNVGLEYFTNIEKNEDELKAEIAKFAGILGEDVLFKAMDYSLGLLNVLWDEISNTDFNNLEQVKALQSQVLNFAKNMSEELVLDEFGGWLPLAPFQIIVLTNENIWHFANELIQPVSKAHLRTFSYLKSEEIFDYLSYLGEFFNKQYRLINFPTTYEEYITFAINFTEMLKQMAPAFSTGVLTLNTGFYWFGKSYI